MPLRLIPWTLVLASHCVGCQVCLAILRFLKRCSTSARGVQEDGQRFITDWSGQRCVFAEKAFTPLLQPARPLRFSKLLQALRDIARRRNTSGKEEAYANRCEHQDP